ncbi:MAG TPA: cyclic nucleotide-binding domain-containing protein, partial [Dehalococcoidia bacterium]|nr:cyclic nucleotide-binding domain-containing protein [Dehalococcoidia bacterium]
ADRGLIDWYECPAGTTIYSQGDSGAEICYVLRRGQVDVLAVDYRHRPNQLARLGPGEVFGESILLNETSRWATIRAVTDVQALILSGQALQILMREFPSASTSLLALMVERQRNLAALHNGPRRDPANALARVFSY